MTNGIEGSTDFGGLISSFLEPTVSGKVSGTDAAILERLKSSTKKIDEIRKEIFGKGNEKEMEKEMEMEM